ncbi:MAG: AraC family transcriptional regulator [Spirochaetaceae bacterium]
MINRKKSYYGIFATLFLPYLILILLLWLMGGVLYYQSLKLAENQIKQKNHFLLEEVEESMATLFVDSKKLFSHLSYVSSSFNFSVDLEDMNKQSMSKELFDIDVKKSLVPSGISHDYILDYFVLIKSPAVILNYELSLPLETYLKYALRFHDDKINEAFNFFYNQTFDRNTFANIVSLIDLNPDNKVSHFTYRMGMIQDFGSSYSEQSGVIVIYIDKNALIKTLKKLDISNEGCVFVLDKDNNIQFGTATGNRFETLLSNSVLTKSDLDVFKENSKWFVTENGSPNQPYRYVVIQSKKYLRDQTKKIRYFLISIMSSLILLGLVFSFIIVYQNSKPVNEMYLEFQERLILYGEDKGKHNNPKGLFSTFNFSVHRMTDYLEEQTELLESTVIKKLLTGYHIHEEERKEVINSCLDIDANRYTVIILSLISDSKITRSDEIGEIALWKSHIKLIMKKQLPGENIYLYDRNPSEIILIKQDASFIKDEQLKSFVESLYTRISTENFSETKISVGSGVQLINDIHYSFEQASIIRDTHNLETDKGISWSVKEDEDSYPLYYPVDFERKLINSVISGDEIALKMILDEIYLKNFVENKISFSLIKILLISMTGILISITKRVVFNDDKLDSSIRDVVNVNITINNYMEYFNKHKEILNRLVDQKNTVKNDRKAKMVQDLCTYIDNNFTNPFLSADHVGQELGITGNYIFKLFKEYYGISFHQYLEKIRMDHAVMQLKDESYKHIKDISLESGYAIQTTFYKAFKKNFGVSPGDYRKSR